MSLASPALRQVFSAIQKALKTETDTPVYFQLVPEHAIYGALGNPTASVSDLDTLCISLYNRILVPVTRTMSRSFFPCDGQDKGNDKAKDKERVRKYFRDPLLTLARPLHARVSFVRAAHASLGVTDRNTFLHVGYQVSPCGKWVLAACVDERGEAHDLGVWLVQTPTQGAGTPEREGSGSGEDVAVGSGEGEDIYAFVVRKVWEFAIEFAKNADVEWRIVVAKLGSMDESELNGMSVTLSFMDLVSINLSSLGRLSCYCTRQPTRNTETTSHPSFSRARLIVDVLFDGVHTTQITHAGHENNSYRPFGFLQQKPIAERLYRYHHDDLCHPALHAPSTITSAEPFRLWTCLHSGALLPIDGHSGRNVVISRTSPFVAPAVHDDPHLHPRIFAVTHRDKDATHTSFACLPCSDVS